MPRSQHIPPQFIYSCETVAKMPRSRFRGQYFYLSNFYPCKDGVEFDGDASPTIIRARLHDIVPRSQDRAASEWIIHNRAAARYQKIVEGTSDKFLGRPTTKPLNLGNILMWLRQESMAAHISGRLVDVTWAGVGAGAGAGNAGVAAQYHGACPRFIVLCMSDFELRSQSVSAPQQSLDDHQNDRTPQRGCYGCHRIHRPRGLT